MLVVIRGAGDIASGIALRLYRCGFVPVMCEIPQPTAIRRTVCFSQAVYDGETTVEDVPARRAELAEVHSLRSRGIIPVLVDPSAACVDILRPDAVVDAILAKKNLGTSMDMAPIVVAVGPGFTAGLGCHAVVETMRGHTLGRVIYEGSPRPDTAIPGLIGGFAGERVLRAPCGGAFQAVRAIGDMVKAGEIVGFAAKQPVFATIGGVLRGILPDGVEVSAGMKCGDVDPRGEPVNCRTVSDKALAVGGGVLEAILHFSASHSVNNS